MPDPTPRSAIVPLADETAENETVRRVFADIKAHKQIDFVPNFWRALASHPPLLEETWLRLRAVMQPGRLDLLTKELIALAVSITNGCTYCIHSHTAAAEKLGLDAAMLGELMQVVGLFNTTNRLADGYQVVPDVFPRLPVDG